ncbi:RNB domain-containing ribonuclease [Arthrobacter sp. TES]|uniref:RNB domain-containing ribonuclease n=1 Tax=Paenarthrobacter ureafaciens TaxID=37931 RepID=UPI00039658DD|nr:RNB domain-containing ribonuclease [Paenarthrobacter ureafaciens]AOY70480.1 ribonuclease II [Arthrobacter sp. ZXY-2]ERI38203.1 ribonuclease II [Arthrobacter sp. AK-YN10]QOI62692.1 RNB domain-containing ribonuclease [Arthrobacter sp. TES]MBN9128608.1 RNB domain-containing ribonuclease [Paenarthrobacter ureafaciens]QSZ53376.1 ribonuclease II [Paenarthrobacter ureafaciens]
MSHHRIAPNVDDSSDRLAASLAALRSELELPGDYPADAEHEARQAVQNLQLPPRSLLDVPFVTIDPATSTDLDQALFIQRNDAGYKVLYAIADVPSFVAPGGALDAETRRRGQTFYAPDGRVPLHPEVISEQAGSLLAEQECSAFVWDFDLDHNAEVVSMSVERATVRSRAKLSYKGAQKQIDAGTAPEVLMLLKEVGLKRVELERKRGGASLNMPEQEIVQVTDGDYRIVAAPSLPIEDWNAQMSLMTGMAAAQLMLDGKVGILRTMPAPDERSLLHFKRQTQALGKPWDGDISYGEYLRTLDGSDPKQLAILHSAGMLFRGAGYTPFDGEVPENVVQSAIGAPYAHTTAPLRRLIDRFVLVICEALSNGREIPVWAREALPDLPGIMAASDSLAGRLERMALDTVEAALAANHVGQVFDAVVISGSKPSNGNGNGNGPYGTVQIAEPAVTARCDGELVSGTQVRVRLVKADITGRVIRFELAE